MVYDTLPVAGWPISKFGCPIFATVSSSLIGVTASSAGGVSFGVPSRESAIRFVLFWLLGFSLGPLSGTRREAASALPKAGAKSEGRSD